MSKASREITKGLVRLVQCIGPQCRDERCKQWADVSVIRPVVQGDERGHAAVLGAKASNGLSPALKIRPPDPSVEERLESVIGLRDGSPNPLGGTTLLIGEREHSIQYWPEGGHPSEGKTRCQQGSDLLVISVAVASSEVDGVWPRLCRGLQEVEALSQERSATLLEASSGGPSGHLLDVCGLFPHALQDTLHVHDLVRYRGLSSL